MNIVHICGGNYGGIPYKYSNLINKLTKHSSRLISIWRMPANYPDDIIFSSSEHSIDYLKRLISNADILHIHQPFIGYNDAGVSLEVGFKNTVGMVSEWVSCGMDHFVRKIIKKKDIVLTYHGMFLRVNQKAVRSFHKTLKNPIYTVTTPDLLYRLSDAIWIPHPINIEDYNPIKKDVCPVNITHSTNDFKRDKSQDIINRIYALKTAHSLNLKLSIIQNRYWKDALEERKKAHISIGRLALDIGNHLEGFYNTSDLEPMALEIPSVSYLDETTLKMVPDIPVVNVPFADFNQKLYDLVTDEGLRREIGKESRKWVIKNHNEKVTVSKLIQTYDMVI